MRKGGTLPVLKKFWGKHPQKKKIILKIEIYHIPAFPFFLPTINNSSTRNFKIASTRY